MELIFEKSVNGRRGFQIPKSDVPLQADIPAKYKRQSEAKWPQVSELDYVRHFTKLSQRNFSIDTNFYPLGSCTMKYNPKFTELAARVPGFANLHPMLPQLKMGDALTQGALQVLYETDRLLCEITGMDDFTINQKAIRRNILLFLIRPTGQILQRRPLPAMRSSRLLQTKTES